MRVRKPTAQGTAELFSAAINNVDNGVLLYVSAGPANPKRQTGTRALMAISEAPSADDITRLNQEGGYNAADGALYIFTFPYGSDVQAGDTFPFNQFKYRLLTAYPQPLGNAILGIRCVAVRTGQGGIGNN